MSQNNKGEAEYSSEVVKRLIPWVDWTKIKPNEMKEGKSNTMAIKKKGRPGRKPGQKSKPQLSVAALQEALFNGDAAEQADAVKRYPVAAIAMLTKPGDILAAMNKTSARKLEGWLKNGGEVAPDSEDSAEETPVKRGPGRPKKSETTSKKKAAPKKAVDEDDEDSDEDDEEEETPKKRGPGRPKGSKNKPAKKSKPAAKKKSKADDEDEDDEDIAELLGDDEEEEDESDEDEESEDDEDDSDDEDEDEEEDEEEEPAPRKRRK